MRRKALRISGLRGLHKEVADKVVAEVPKNISGQPVDKIEEQVKRALAEAS